MGKTLSLAAAALVSCLLDDGPVLILCPATLTLQWQVELADKLGIPSAWSGRPRRSSGSIHRGHEIRVRGPGGHRTLPLPDRDRVHRTHLPRIGRERINLLNRKVRHGHPRRGAPCAAPRRPGQPRAGAQQPAHLHVREIAAPATRHLLLGTATPDPDRCAASSGTCCVCSMTDAEFVLGRKVPRALDSHRAERCPLVKGKRQSGRRARGMGLDPRSPAAGAASTTLYRSAAASARVAR